MFDTFDFMAFNWCCILGGPYYPYLPYKINLLYILTSQGSFLLNGYVTSNVNVPYSILSVYLSRETSQMDHRFMNNPLHTQQLSCSPFLLLLPIPWTSAPEPSLFTGPFLISPLPNRVKWGGDMRGQTLQPFGIRYRPRVQ